MKILEKIFLEKKLSLSVINSNRCSTIVKYNYKAKIMMTLKNKKLYFQN